MFKSLSQNWKRGTVSLGMALAMLGMIAFSVPSAQAATTAELQAQINALLAQIAQLNSGSSAGCYSFTRDLTVGAQGADVSTLQNFLAGKGYFHAVATGYFGPITASAVAQWQAANGVAPAAGYFGAISRAKYNSMCYVAPNPKPTPGDDDDDNFGGGDEEASLEDFDVRDGDDTNIEEGASNQEIMEIRFDVEDSDVEVQRADVTFEFIGTDDGEEDPWRVFESATLLMNGKRVAELDNLDDEDNWDEQGADTYSIRFNRINKVIREGDRAEFVLALDVGNGVDGIDVGGANSWNVYVDDNGIRALDEAGIDQYTGDDSDGVEVDIEEAGIDDELSLREGDDNPEAQSVEVDDSKKSDWQTLGVMELSAEGDIELKDFLFNVLVNQDEALDETYNNVISDLVLVIDGEEYDDFTVSNANTATATVSFDLSDEDVIIEDGDKVDVEVQVQFKPLTGNYDEATTVAIETPSALFDSVDAEGVDSSEDLDANQLDGSFDGELFTLRTEGISLVGVSKEARRSFVADDSGEFDQGTFKIVFEVTAFGEDIFIDNSTPVEDNDGSEVSTSLSYSVSNPSDNSSVGVLSATGGDYGTRSNSWRISAGDTAEFTLEVIVVAEADSSAAVTLEAIGYSLSDVDGTTAHIVPSEPQFKTNAITLLAA